MLLLSPQGGREIERGGNRRYSAQRVMYDCSCFNQLTASLFSSSIDIGLKFMVNSMKKLAILGSTGSIGRQTLQVVRNLTSRFRVIGLTAGQNNELLSEQITEFKPKFIYYQSKTLKLAALMTGIKISLPGRNCRPSGSGYRGYCYIR